MGSNCMMRDGMQRKLNKLICVQSIELKTLPVILKLGLMVNDLHTPFIILPEPRATPILDNDSIL